MNKHMQQMCVVKEVVQHQGPLLLTWTNFYPSMYK